MRGYYYKQEWDLQPISCVISQREVNEIKEVQIGDPSCNGRLIWPMKKRGTLTVKSGYHWIHSKEHPNKL